MESSFRFADLFAGIGGFHAALTMMGGECVLASEIDDHAAHVYRSNWMDSEEKRSRLWGDIAAFAPDDGPVKAPKHDVLTAGFPCQPFSKSGAQLGTRDRVRGTLYFNILRIIESRRPSVVLLENVRNLAGPRHKETWSTIIATLRQAGYRVSDTPAVMSPHLIPPELGGTPQIRDRVFIAAVYVGKRRALRETDVAPVVSRSAVGDWRPHEWDLARTPLLATGGHPLLEEETSLNGRRKENLTASEVLWIDAWDDFVRSVGSQSRKARLPGFPLWVDSWGPRPAIEVTADTPNWKRAILAKNVAFFEANKQNISRWMNNWNLLDAFPASRRKLEWQAQDAQSLWDCIIHLRPSGIRVKRPTYLPALVAISQTPIIGPRRRKLTPREAARLQSLPDSFDFGAQGDGQTFKQLGNGVSVGVVYYVMREFLRQNISDIPESLATVAQGLPEGPNFSLL